MIKTSPAKINIGLEITGKREDGYHLLESLMIPIPLEDIIEVIENNKSTDRLFSFGILPDVRDMDNLVIRAVNLFRDNVYPSLPSLDIALYKRIPFGAGLGGGSSNAVTTIKILRDKYCPALGNEKLKNMVVSLGADCPFFVDQVPQIARGIGEILNPIKNFSLADRYLLLIKPDINISTRDAFCGISINEYKTTYIENNITLPLDKWQGVIQNRFEDTLFPIYPILKEIKEWMLSNGCIFSSLTGSGATMYCISDKSIRDMAKKRFPYFFIWESLL